MKKDFAKWHQLKSDIENERQAPLFREREIWWCSLGANVGIEADGRNDLFERPIIVFRKFNRDMFLGLPLSSGNKEGQFYFSFEFNHRPQTIILSQVRVLSSKRLLRKFGKLSDSKFAILDEKFVDFLKRKNLREEVVSGA